MPKLWAASVESHRRGVRAAILDSVGELAAEYGLRAVTMGKLAQSAGIGRATLYKYFPDIEAVLLAWHERQVAAHLEQVGAAGEGAGGPAERFAAMLDAYALILFRAHGWHEAEIETALHAHAQARRAEERLAAMLREAMVEGIASGEIREDGSPDELLNFSLTAITAARRARSRRAVTRLVALIMAALHPDRAAIHASGCQVRETS